MNPTAQIPRETQIDREYTGTKTNHPVKTMNALIATALIGWLACSSLLAAGPATGSTALFQAIRDGDSAAVRKLLKGGVDLRLSVKVLGVRRAEGEGPTARGWVAPRCPA